MNASYLNNEYPNQKNHFWYFEERRSNISAVFDSVWQETRRAFGTIQKIFQMRYCSAPWVVNKYHWEVVDNKLYLIEINYGLCPTAGQLYQRYIW